MYDTHECKVCGRRYFNLDDAERTRISKFGRFALCPDGEEGCPGAIALTKNLNRAAQSNEAFKRLLDQWR